MKRKHIIIIIGLVLLSLTTLTVVAYSKKLGPFNNPENDTVSQQPSSQESTGATDTFTSTTEGKDVQIPNTVDPDSIKPYELLVENDHFKIRRLNQTYTITLYAIINRPDQASLYQEQLKEYKQEALEFLKNKGLDTTKLEIVYEPNEASTL